MTAKIDQILASAVASGDLPGVVALAADARGVIYEGAAGRRAADSEGPITQDTVLRIASMTKMITTAAALQLWEQGRLDLDAPVRDYRPEFAALPVLEGFDDGKPRLRSPRSQATVRQLITHTAGLAYWFWNADIDRYEQVTGTPNVLSGSNAAFSAPLVADPGTRFEYGTNLDWLGRLVETISGQSLDVYVGDHITGPLGMSSTTALMTAQQRASSSPVHIRAQDGSWTVTDMDFPQRPDYWSGGHFLYTTPRDYLAFQRMLLCGGTFGGVRILRPATVDAAFANQIGELCVPALIPTARPDLSADFRLGPGLKWGLGLLLNQTRQPGMRAVGAGAWAGIFNTYFWVDRTSGITGAIYCQTLPFAEPSVFQVYVDFEQALYASLSLSLRSVGRRGPASPAAHHLSLPRWVAEPRWRGWARGPG
jgi:CubicO group peptidase (beta-lactamase class C family)